MPLINVYSRSPISHKFKLSEDGYGEAEFIIEGTNRHGVILLDKKTPRITQIEDSIFEKIKEKYKSHVKLFGGKSPDGISHQPLIYIAKTEKDASKMMEDAAPIITENEMATKTKNIKVTG